MEKENIINSYIDTKIKNGLYSKTSNSFSEALLDKFRLELQFTSEDKKADNVFKVMFVTLITTIVAITSVVIYSVYSGDTGAVSESPITSRFLETYYSLSFDLKEVLSLPSELNLLLILPLIALIFIGFNVLDKKYLRKNL